MFLYMYMHACTLYCIFNVSVKCWKIKMGYIQYTKIVYVFGQGIDTAWG